MSTSSSSEVLSPPSSRTGRSVWRRWKDFHAHHGVWALGVKLMRRWSIRTKVLLLLAIIALPLVPLSVHVVGENNALVAASVRHLAAVKLSSSASALGTELNTQLQALAVGRAVDGGLLARRHDELLEALAQAGAAGVAPAPGWAAAQPLVRRAARESGLSVDGRTDATRQANDALRMLRKSAAATLSATITHDGTLDRTATIALDLLPDLQMGAGQLRGLVMRRMQLRQSAAAVAAEQHALLVATAGKMHDLQRLAEESEQGLAMLPPQVAVATSRSLPKTRAMLDLARSTLLGHASQSDEQPLLLRLSESRQELMEARQQMLDDLVVQVQQRLDQARDIQLGMAKLLLACLAVAAYLGYTFFLVMRGGLGALNLQMNRMAEGDLRGRPVPRGHDEVAATMHAMTTSLARLSDLLAAVRHGVSGVSEASKQMALGNAEMSSRNRKTAAGLEGVASSVQRYTQQLEACGREIEGVVTSVQALRLEAARNRKHTTRLSERLNSLRGRSREIGEVVRLIDAIAFRTNILALNASVEASKAGEAGRGFAVVAQEVRSLALRSAESAKRIDQIIGRSTEDIERSGELADEAGRALGELDAHVDKIHVSMNDVAQLTRQGEDESANILLEVQRLTDGSGKNQQLVEQLVLAADSLRSQGERLSQGIGQFTLS